MIKYGYNPLFYRISSNFQKEVIDAIRLIVVVVILFLLFYNPKLYFMSSGFTRYVFIFLLISVLSFEMIRKGVIAVISNIKYVALCTQELKVVRTVTKLLTFIISYFVSPFIFGGLSEFIMSRWVDADYAIILRIVFTLLTYLLLEYSNILHSAAFFCLAYMRDVRLRFSDANLFTFTLIAYWFGLALFFTGSTIYLNAYDFSLASNMLKTLFFIFPVAFLTIRYMQKKDVLSFDTLLRLWSYATALQAIFIILDWFVPSFSSLLQTLLDKNPMMLRSSGVTREAGDGLSYIQALGAMASFYLYIFNNTVKKNSIFALTFIMQLTSITFVGRTGFVLVFVFIIASLILNNHRIKNIFYLVKLAVITTFTGYILYALLIPAEIKNLMEINFLPWAFEFVYSFLEQGTFETASTTDIKENMLFLPDTQKTFFIGDGYYQDKGNKLYNYMGTDSGYVRLIFYNGLVGSILFYLYFIIMSAIMYKISIDRRRFVFILSIMTMLFIAHIKYPFMVMASTHLFLLLFYFCLLAEYKKPTSNYDNALSGLR